MDGRRAKAEDASDDRFVHALPGAIAGRYAAVRLLAAGPLFATILATRTCDGATCVVKRVARASAPAEAHAMLAREARLLAVLDGRGVLAVVERGDDFIVTEHAALPTLGEATPSMLWGPATRALFAALAALHDAADARGALHAIHGDVTPSNAFVASDGARALLGDLGLASFRDGVAPRDGAFRGSLLYCAPEVARGEAPTVAADLFALAASILHVGLAVPPRAAGSFAALLAVAAERRVDAYDRVALGGLPRAGHDALRACLAFDPASRPARARDVLVLMPLA